MHDWLNLGNIGQPRTWLSDVPDQASALAFCFMILWPLSIGDYGQYVTSLTDCLVKQHHCALLGLGYQCVCMGGWVMRDVLSMMGQELTED